MRKLIFHLIGFYIFKQISYTLYKLKKQLPFWITWLCGDARGSILEIMYHNTPSNAIVNVVSNISYRLLLENIIQTTYTGRCYRPRFFQYFLMNKLKNLTNDVIEKIGKYYHKQSCFYDLLLLEIIILLLYTLDILLLKQKKLPVLDITGFFFRIRTHVNALKLSL